MSLHAVVSLKIYYNVRSSESKKIILIKDTSVGVVVLVGVQHFVQCVLVV